MALSTLLTSRRAAVLAGTIVACEAIYLLAAGTVVLTFGRGMAKFDGVYEETRGGLIILAAGLASATVWLLACGLMLIRAPRSARGKRWRWPLVGGVLALHGALLLLALRGSDDVSAAAVAGTLAVLVALLVRVRSGIPRPAGRPG